MTRKRDASIYILKGIDPKLWQQFKQACTAQDHTLKWVLMSLIRAYVDGAEGGRDER